MASSLRVTIALLAVLLAAPAAYAAKPNIQWNKDYDFSHVKTYAWQDPAQPSLAQSNPFMHKFIQDEIEKRLTAAGLTKAVAGAAPDLWVTYHGAVIVDIVDPAKKELVWRGSSTPILISDSNEKTQKNISKALDAMVKQNTKLRADEKKQKEKEAKQKAKEAQKSRGPGRAPRIGVDRHGS